MRVLYFGTYERDYPRNAQVISCLRRAGVDVVECNVPIWEGHEHKWQAETETLVRLLGAQLKLLRVRPDQVEDVTKIRWATEGLLDLVQPHADDGQPDGDDEPDPQGAM